MKYIVAVCAAAVLPLITAAQTNFAGLSGVVTDPQSRAVQGARVVTRSLETGAIRSVVSNTSGMYQLPDLAPGNYEISIEATGFAPALRRVHLEVGQTVQITTALEVGAAHAVVEVSSQPEMLKTSDASLAEVVETKSVQELPLNGRMLLDLAVTVPGSHLGSGAQEGNTNPLYWRPNQNSALSIGGNRPNANYFLVDGVTNTDATFNTQNQSFAGRRAGVSGADRNLHSRYGRRGRRAD